MADSLIIVPEFKATGQVRRASSNCCAAKLNPGRESGTYTCRACGKPCERVMSGPEEVTLHG